MKIKFQLLLFTTLLLLNWSIFAQVPDWRTYDPKKATPDEAARMNKWIEDNHRRAHGGLGKSTGLSSEIRSVIMRGNKITTIVYNYGNITRPNTLGNVADLVWNKLGYGFEFDPLVAGEVLVDKKDTSGAVIGKDTIRILDDGMWLIGQGGYSPDGSQKWGWLPKAGYAAPSPNLDIASWSHRSDVGGDLTRKPHSWPESWYNNVLGRYVWPAFLGSDATTPDEEVYFIVDDYTNKKYEYYPFAPIDSSKRGLGLDMECRFFQFNNPLAEDIIFLVYQVTNRSKNTINRVYFGMYGDPHVGGPSDYSDDLMYFIPPRGPLADPFAQRARSMVYAWDNNSRGDYGLVPGYFGFKFLESPSNSVDGIDNDDDGITDENPSNDAGIFIDGKTLPLYTGISDTTKFIKRYGALKPRWSGDEDGDWDPTKDDVGLDGIPNTGDSGEGNGRPDIGPDSTGRLICEPNFGNRDVHESDAIGLTSFYALEYHNSTLTGGTNLPKNDTYFWQLLASDSIAIDQEYFSTPGDNIFLYGSGPFKLAPGETQRFSIALLMGVDLPDLLLNSETAQRVYEANYRFAQPPPKPNVTVISGDKKVTLYWDNSAEKAVDPLTGVNDFEGYKIYRSEDPTFSDVFTITDANGTPFLGKPFLQNGFPAQFDLNNEYSGLNPVEYLGRGVKYDQGKNTGLVHEYVDSSVTNGKKYYYAVVSYDHGYDSSGVQLPPTESQASIIQDPITGKLTFDVNTVEVVPGPLPAGSIVASLLNNGDAEHLKGNATGKIIVKVFDHFAVKDQASYKVDFQKKSGKILYNIYPFSPATEKIVSRDTIFVTLSHKNLMVDSVQVYDANGVRLSDTLYQIDAPGGRIRGKKYGWMPKDKTFEIRYQYYTVFESNRLNSEDDNPVFDGIRVYVKDDPLALDTARSGWIYKNNTNLNITVQKSEKFNNLPVLLGPWDIRIVWNNTAQDSLGRWLYRGDTLYNALKKKGIYSPFRIVNMTDTTKIEGIVAGTDALRDSLWKPGREVTLLAPAWINTNPGVIKNPVMFSYKFNPPADTSIKLILPEAGNTYEAKTTKPFSSDDKFKFTTKALQFNKQKAESDLDKIYVVPNPYVAYSAVELPGISATQRGENKLQFRNLPPKCTIRIYTLTGELVDIINKDDSKSYADWLILSYEGHRLAYGVYIYHVEVPGVGNKIGRFALIK